MDPKTIDIISGAGRTLGVSLLWWFISKGYLPGGDFVGIVIGSIITLAIVVWSVLEKKGAAATFFSQAMGAGRNLLMALLSFAAGRGWIKQDDVGPIVAALGAIAMTFWSTESKVLAAKASRYVIPFLCVGVLLMGCATNPTPQQVLDIASGTYTAAKVGYAATCASFPQIVVCSADNREREQRAEKIADAALLTAQDAINLGTGDPMKLIGDFIQDAALIESLFNQADQMKRSLTQPTLWERITR